MKKIIPVFGIFAFALLLFSCGKEKGIKFIYFNEEETKVLDQANVKIDFLNNNNYQINLPENLSRAGLSARQVDADKAMLGRVLFYDKKLSKDGTIACASCHKQELGFADNTAFSKGVNDRVGTRNSIGLASVANFSAYYGTDLNGSGAIRFFWDNRAGTAKEQAKGSLGNEKEMDMHMNEVVESIINTSYYKPLWRVAFSEKSLDDSFTDAEFANLVNEEAVLDAISSFVDAMGSYQSKFDTESSNMIKNSELYGNYNPLSTTMEQDFAGFTAAENRGKALYQFNCAGCHSSNMGRPVYNYANNGLDQVSTVDLGVGGVLEFENFSDTKGAFKVPTLRNINLTAPYMHDGRFASLSQVIDHYSTDIKNCENLHSLLRNTNGTAKKMNFTDTEKSDLISFLSTLTDNNFATDEKYSNPFK